MNKRPWMPFYVMEYLSDTAHLTPAESGAYIHLIIYYWVNRGLPDDESAVARITRLKPIAWKRSRDTLKALFKGGPWKHPRIELELAQVVEKSKLNSAKARIRHSRGYATAHTLTHTHTKKVSVNGFEGSKKEETEKKTDRKWIAQGTEQWKAWDAYYIKTKGVRPSVTTSNNEIGWWFDSEFPR